jgi:hypothetical protein
MQQLDLTPPAATDVGGPKPPAPIRSLPEAGWWDENRDEVVLEEQPRTAVYWNNYETLVIRQEGRGGDDDSVILIAKKNLRALINRLTTEEGA